MNKLQELLVITMEECGELTQRCSKVLRRSNNVEDIHSDDKEKLLEEAGDVYCMIQLMIQQGLFSYYDLEIRAKKKREKLKTWSSLIDE